MGIRTVCFVAAVVATGPMRWIFVACAILLPYVAVILANTASTRTSTSAQSFQRKSAGRLESGTQGDAE